MLVSWLVPRSNVEKEVIQESIVQPLVLSIPTGILQDREVSILESIVEYLRDHQGLRFSDIARMLNRDDRTIWTVYKRAKGKRA